ncbi:MAG: hypothetical protein FWD94_03430 [Treponema sp.]|nr:hypothetical protein [Treponema sp.]
MGRDFVFWGIIEEPFNVIMEAVGILFTVLVCIGREEHAGRYGAATRRSG